MGAFVVYVIKSAFCLAAFYIFYKFLLSRDTFHKMNRIAILTCMALSCLIPLVKYTVKESTIVNQPMLELEDFLTVSVEQPAEVTEVYWCWYIYWVQPTSCSGIYGPLGNLHISYIIAG